MEENKGQKREDNELKPGSEKPPKQTDADSESSGTHKDGDNYDS